MNRKTVIEPFREVVAYEALWKGQNASFKTIAEMFSKRPESYPSDMVSKESIQSIHAQVEEYIHADSFGYKTYALIKGTYDYPEGLKDAKEPLELLYYTGKLSYLESRCIAIVGTRNPSAEGVIRTQQLTRKLVRDNFTIVSGLAMGIDTKAHETAMAEKGRTIAVIGTPMDTVYPKENKELQIKIAKEHLLVSQVPFLRYKEQGAHINRFFFPERNKTMSALTEATVIVEAGETSGTLIQARAALYQKRKLFIMESNFHNKEITWPEKYLKQGAIRVSKYEDILEHLDHPPSYPTSNAFKD